MSDPTDEPIHASWPKYRIEMILSEEVEPIEPGLVVRQAWIVAPLEDAPEDLEAANAARATCLDRLHIAAWTMRNMAGPAWAKALVDETAQGISRRTDAGFWRERLVQDDMRQFLRSGVLSRAVHGFGLHVDYMAESAEEPEDD
ncbi:hypothetical protein EOD42_13975 [Rhodovarius crocodyli]|uniref:Uncharacterized protein n=1 Tax=Rhodovarius crocodyli TaxID=1979269 RepID=A0A437MF20_9PROT|nr:hypothetical protein [Rhodovarius crocodyli]RVT96219.1 hypothetical protein EOD42_13975 [Rhodovarius crocodyli]